MNEPPKPPIGMPIQPTDVRIVDISMPFSSVIRLGSKFAALVSMVLLGGFLLLLVYAAFRGWIG